MLWDDVIYFRPCCILRGPNFASQDPPIHPLSHKISLQSALGLRSVERNHSLTFFHPRAWLQLRSSRIDYYLLIRTFDSNWTFSAICIIYCFKLEQRDIGYFSLLQWQRDEEKVLHSVLCDLMIKSSDYFPQKTKMIQKFTDDIAVFAKLLFKFSILEVLFRSQPIPSGVNKPISFNKPL